MSASADHVRGPGDRQYHIGLTPERVMPNVLMCGDPARVTRAAHLLFAPVPEPVRSREYLSYAGRTPGGVPLTLLATGMGPDNTEIAVVELLNCRRDLTFIRVGSCGALQPELQVGDLVVSSGAVRLENTTAGFVEPGYPAVAHHEVVGALIEGVRAQGLAPHVGITATAPGFYGWQGRRDQPLPPRDPELLDRLARQRVMNMEMEASALFVLASLAGCRAGAVCAVFASRPRDVFIQEEEKSVAEARALHAAVRAFEALHARDARENEGGGDAAPVP